MAAQDDEQQDFVVEIRVVYPKALSQQELKEWYQGSTEAAAHSLIGTAQQLPKDYKVVVAGFAGENRDADQR